MNGKHVKAVDGPLKSGPANSQKRGQLNQTVFKKGKKTGEHSGPSPLDGR